jgi:DnaJ-domain-containing protein 1
MNTQDPSRENPFATLGLGVSYEIDSGAIERAYLKKIAAAHPDRVGDSGAVDAATLNDARACLLDDESRANAVLRLLGGPSASDDQSLPDGFLMEMMTTRTSMEEDLESDPETARADWTKWGNEQREQLLGEFGRLIKDPASLGACRTQLNALRYIERLIEQLDPEYDPARADFR